MFVNYCQTFEKIGFGGGRGISLYSKTAESKKPFIEAYLNKESVIFLTLYRFNQNKPSGA